MPAGSSAIVPRIKVKLGPCPTRFPRVKLATLNARAKALETKLVPFDPLSARVCAYSIEGLVASGALERATATELATDTNALPKALRSVACAAAGLPGSRRFLVTFDDTVQRVHVQATDACGGSVTNGVVTAKETKPWAVRVAQAATKKESRATTR